MNLSRLHTTSVAMLLSALSSLTMAQDCTDTEFYKTKQEAERKLSQDSRAVFACLADKGGAESFAKGREPTKIQGDQLCGVKLPAACGKQQQQFCSTVKRVSVIYDAQPAVIQKESNCSKGLVANQKKDEPRPNVIPSSTCEGPNCVVK